MPTFEPDEGERRDYRGAFQSLLTRRPAILAADMVVIDLRGNQGGSSFWSEQAAKALWGSAPVQSFEDSDPSRVWWRASQGNTDHVARLAETLRTQGQPDIAAVMHRAAEGMRSALARAEPYYVEPTDPTGPTSGGTVAPLRTPVYVIVPGQCASACLDALDVFTHFPNTKLIGAPSSADSVYLEIRVQALPDGLAKVVIPNKLYRNRPRASGQVYPPALEVRDLSWSTAAFKGVVEADLKASRLSRRSPACESERNRAGRLGAISGRGRRFIKPTFGALSAGLSKAQRIAFDTESRLSSFPDAAAIRRWPKAWRPCPPAPADRPGGASRGRAL